MTYLAKLRRIIDNINRGRDLFDFSPISGAPSFHPFGGSAGEKGSVEVRKPAPKHPCAWHPLAEGCIVHLEGECPPIAHVRRASEWTTQREQDAIAQLRALVLEAQGCPRSTCACTATEECAISKLIHGSVQAH